MFLKFFRETNRNSFLLILILKTFGQEQLCAKNICDLVLARLLYQGKCLGEMGGGGALRWYMPVVLGRKGMEVLPGTAPRKSGWVRSAWENGAEELFKCTHACLCQQAGE